MNAIYETRRIKIAEAAQHYGTAKIIGSDQAKKFIADKLGDHFDGCDVEEFHIVCLNTKNVVQAIVRVTRGTLDASIVHPRDVFRAAIEANSSSILLVHNHPSGYPKPSPEDIAVTERLTDVGELIGINVLDHIVYGDKNNLISIKSLN